MKRLFQHWFKTEGFRVFICWLAAHYIRLVHYTSRRHYVVDPGAEPYVRGERAAVFSFWHGRLMLMPMLCPPGRKMNVLISIHRDGEMIARTMHHFGCETIRGSTSRGGASAAMNAVKGLQAGENLSITPDGPRGPAMKVQPGLITVAELAGAPVVPVSFSSTRNRRMNSWDRFMVALPFGSVHYRVGAPLINPTAEALEAVMVENTAQVDRDAKVAT